MESDCLLENKCFKEINEQSSFNASSFSMHQEQTTISNDDNNDNNESIFVFTTTSIANVTDQSNGIEFADLICAVLFCLLIIITVIGNTLVILSVITTRRLRTVTNCFVMSLAVADWLVGIFVMPPAVAYYLVGM